MKVISSEKRSKPSLVTGLRGRCHVSPRVYWVLMRLRACAVPLRSLIHIGCGDPEVRRSDGSWLRTEAGKTAFHRCKPEVRSQINKMRSAFWLESRSDLDEEPRRPPSAAAWRPGFALTVPAAADSRGVLSLCM